MAKATKIAKSKSIYNRLNTGKLNLYKIFVERAHSLVTPGGMVGLLTPSGIASDLSASKFFRNVATAGHLKSLYDFENRRTRFAMEPFFPDVDSRFKFLVIIASPERKFEASKCAFFLQSVAELKNPEQAFLITAADFARVNPNTGTAPIFRTRRDKTLTTAIYDRQPVLVDKSGQSAVFTWPLKYWQMINMTSDSHLFRTKQELEGKEAAWPVGSNCFQSKTGEWVPLYEGKMVQAYDHRAASVFVNSKNLNRPAQPLPATVEQSSDPAWLPDPQFWIRKRECSATNNLPWTLGFKEITAPTNVRTFIAAAFPSYGFGNKVPILTPLAAGLPLELLLGNFNSIPFDYVTRQKIQGQTLNWFIIEQLPVIPPADYVHKFGPQSAAEIVKAAVLELTYTAHDMAPFARDMGHVDGAGEVLPPFAWNEDHRLQLRAKLDALYFILYGVYDPASPEQSRDDIRYIYSTFPIVERQELAAYGRYRSRDLALAWINALMADQPNATVEG